MTFAALPERLAEHERAIKELRTAVDYVCVQPAVIETGLDVELRHAFALVELTAEAVREALK